MEGVLLSALGGRRNSSSTRPRMELEALDARTLHLQLHALEKGTVNGYSTGARDYLNFCISHSLSIEPTTRCCGGNVLYPHANEVRNAIRPYAYWVVYWQCNTIQAVVNRYSPVPVII